MTMNPKTDNKDKAEAIDFDYVLTQCGAFGCFQVLLIVLAIPIMSSGAAVFFGQIFMTEIPVHWCLIPELGKYPIEERVKMAIPPDPNTKYGYSYCKTYDVDWGYMIKTGERPADNARWPLIDCKHGWEYNTSEIPYPTISTELDWVCERDSYQASAQAGFFLGSILGGIIFGNISDKYGRVPVIVASNVMGIIGGVASTFAQNFVQFTVIRFFTGIAFDNNIIMYYLLLIEYVAPKYRSFIANASLACFFGITAVVLPWVSLACGHWKTISWVCSIPGTFALLVPFLGIESPRWLVSKGRVDEAVNKLERIAKCNRKEISPQLLEQFRMNAGPEDEGSGNMLDMLRRPQLRRTFIITCLVFMCDTVVFDALVRSLGALSFDFFISFSVINATEIPAMLLVAVTLDFIGRRWLVCVSLFVSGVFSLFTAFTGGGIVSVVGAVIARFASNIAYAASLQWVAEIMPTPVRGSAVSYIHIGGCVAFIISPYIVYLDYYLLWLPMVLVAIIAFIGSAGAFILPETTRKELPQTFEDAEARARDQKLFDFPCFTKHPSTNAAGTSSAA